MSKRLKLFISLLFVLSLLIVGLFYLRHRKANSDSSVNDGEVVVKQDISEGFPIYPGATLESSYTTEADNPAESWVWKTDAGTSDVSNFYKEELKNNGWEITSDIKDKDSYTFGFTKEEKFGFIGIGKGEGNLTFISVTIGVR